MLEIALADRFDISQTQADRLERLWQDWLHRAKERAALIEDAAPRAPKAQKHKLADLTPAYPSWFEHASRRYPEQDAPNVVKTAKYRRVPRQWALEEKNAA